MRFAQAWLVESRAEDQLPIDGNHVYLKPIVDPIISRVRQSIR
jgi:hypothetical protein